jgi:hypothetical protein
MDEYVLVHTKDLPRKMVLNLAVITKPSRRQGGSKNDIIWERTQTP